jgi:hypothetical protein
MAGDLAHPWTPEDELLLAIRFGLRKGLRSVRGRRAFDEAEQRTIAAAILDHLQLSNYRIIPGQPRRGHSALMPGPAGQSSDRDSH